jgi:Outer membrane protein and related peptidoglycan-associated (lipo)proteins
MTRRGTHVALLTVVLAVSPWAARAQLWKAVRDQIASTAAGKAASARQQAESTVVSASGSLTAGFADSLAASLRNGRTAVPALGFDATTKQLAASASPALSALASVMQRGAGRYRVEAYVDPSGDPRADLALSEARASIIRDQLLAIGVPADRVMAVGLGAVPPAPAVDSSSVAASLGAAAADAVPGVRLAKLGLRTLRRHADDHPSIARIEIVRLP